MTPKYNALMGKALEYLLRRVKMYWSFDELPDEYKKVGIRLWAFDYATNNTEKSKGLNAKPYMCEFGPYVNDTRWAECFKVNGNGKRGKQSVKCNSRHYALTENEAIEGYNDLVDEVIGFLIRMAKVYEKDKIEI